MGYSREHKAETHAKLLKLASETLRRDGPDKLGVIELMRAAGLTHGGFYAHFRSRDDLLIEALNAAFDHALARYQRYGEGLPPRQALGKFIDLYLSAAHRDTLSVCPIVTLNSDLPRQPRAFRAAYRAGVQKLVEAIGLWIDGAGVPSGQERAADLLGEMAGVIGMSRAVADRSLSDDLLAAARRRIRSQLNLGSAS
jgi:TetR/AcrR family transcriptional regulator, transcriptional repressor for nem operon